MHEASSRRPLQTVIIVLFAALALLGCGTAPDPSGAVVPDAADPVALDAGMTPDAASSPDAFFGDAVDQDAEPIGLVCEGATEDCNGNPDDGCEVDLSGRASCGACGVTCGPTESCNEGRCLEPSVASALLLTSTDYVSVHDAEYDSEGSLYVAASFRGSITFGTRVFRSGPGARSSGLILSFDTAGALRWGYSFGTRDNSQAKSLALDGDGNVYVTGSMAGTGWLGHLSQTVPRGASIMVASFTRDGVPRWFDVHVDSELSASSRCAGIELGAGGDVFIAGDSYAAIDFGGGFVPVGVFLARFSSEDGSHRWSTAHGPFEDHLTVKDLALDSADNIYLTRNFIGRGDFGGGTFRAGGVAGSSSAALEAFVASYTADSGAYRWAHLLGGANYDSGNGLWVDDADVVYVTGFVTEAAELGGGVVEVTPDLGRKLFVSSFEAASGEFRWARVAGNAGGAASSSASDISGADGHLYVTGSFTGPADLGGGPVDSARHPEGYASDDVFVLSLSATDGAYEWARSFGGAMRDYSSFVTATPGDGVLMGTRFQGTVGFDEHRLDSSSGYSSALVEVVP